MSPPSEAEARRKLAAPTLAMLPRISDGLSFLYIDIARVEQTETGVCATIETQDGHPERTHLPTAALACVLLGPGTSITQRALTTLMRHGTTVIAVGAGGVRCYGGIQPTDRTTRWLERQAHAWADPTSRLDVARRMYELRFREDIEPGTPVASMRGTEGKRMQALYRALAQRHAIGRFKRSYNPDDWEDQDPVNRALSAVSAAMYGVSHAVIAHLGCSPGLGFIHAGKHHALVYDLADLYKAEFTVPLAFSLHDSTNPEAEARRRLREDFRLYRLLPRMVGDLQWLLDPDQPGLEEREDDEEEGPARIVELWDPEHGCVAGGVNYGDGVD
ncbi:type I-E CRISPR-associated endonuclease Cas1e [Lipingzhangella sp. LS1_29]|uniref:CRISPR-associated endonuclease Cas1 n=1 Tax=Lipingzhangella rawalii TaxID=2055835 RepID=A0ABU2H3C0_9ACTN|nr:type I-E CRISPR-associated endonuclease Cas1e [Lipingzhangella rawalii]MDS1269793.1 type I-E CRISPR-associated endonuclease Cas1e [Lipingzhangella rawalii]